MNIKVDWKECNFKRLVKPAKREDHIIKSLTESADANLQVAKSIKQEDISYSSIVVLAYDSLRMLLEALALKNGYKIYNHECYTPFLKEILHKEELAGKFDSSRLIRNSVNYYGKRFNKNEFDTAYSDILYLMPLIKEMLKNE